MSKIEKLPAWMKAARNRDDVLAATAGLRTRLDGSGRATARATPGETSRPTPMRRSRTPRRHSHTGAVAARSVRLRA
jgi:hypothetical protein